jgi:hypothetical protein
MLELSEQVVWQEPAALLVGHVVVLHEQHMRSAGEERRRRDQFHFMCHGDLPFCARMRRKTMRGVGCGPN